MSEQAGLTADPAGSLLAFYDVALPNVYGYLSSRCGGRNEAEDLTAETFLAAVDAVRSDYPPRLTMPWIIGVARHKLADHWRRQAREDRRMQVVQQERGGICDDPWDARLDALCARETLHHLAPSHKAALTLRYVDDLPVTDVAEILHRTVHATEALLVRARVAFRRAYTETEAGNV